MSFRVIAPTVVRRGDYLIPEGYMRCAAPRCRRFARYPTEDPKVGYCLVHDHRAQTLRRRARRNEGRAGKTAFAHILTADCVWYRPGEALDPANARKLRSLCGIETSSELAVHSKWLSFTEGRYWLNVITGTTSRGSRQRSAKNLRLETSQPLVCHSCVNAYSAILREEHLGLPGRMFVLRITHVENELVVWLHPEGPGVGQYISRDLSMSLDLTAACMFANLESALEARALFESKYHEAGVTVAVRRMVEDPQEDCSALDPLQERLAWYGGAFRHSDGREWHQRLTKTFGIEFRLPHEEEDEA